MLYDRICLMIPTRGRVRRKTGPDGLQMKNHDGALLWEGKLATMLQSSMENTALPTSEVIDYCFMINETDTATLDFLQYRMAGYRFQILTENEPEPHLAKFYNRLYEETRFNLPGTLCSMIGDDFVFNTKGYEQRILKAVNEYQGKKYVWCNDAYIAGPNCAVNMFVPRNMVEDSGHPFMWPICRAEMMDEVWTRAHELIGIGVYLMDVIIEHNHEGQKPEEMWDETFKRLTPIQRAAHAEHGDRTKMQAYANEIAVALKSKGYGTGGR